MSTWRPLFRVQIQVAPRELATAMPAKPQVGGDFDKVHQRLREILGVVIGSRADQNLSNSDFVAQNLCGLRT
jgi:hypothetical protein